MSPRPCSIHYVPRRNKYSVSYGLVVFTKYPTKRVVLVERKIPYCLQNRLWKDVNKQSYNTMLVSTETETETDATKKTKTIRMRNTTSISSIIGYIRKFLKSYKVEDLKLDEPCEIEDFIKYKTGKIFEDKFDFPHGQMTRRTKTYLNRKIDYLRRIRRNNNNNNNNNNQDINIKQDINNYNNHDGDEEEQNDKEKLLKKFAGFITAFTEFEEETGFTFKFDSDMVKKDVIEMVLKFKGLDDYIYEQHFFIVTVDKIEKWKRKEKSSKIFHEIVSLEMDRQVYKAWCMDVEEAKKLFLFQQHDNRKVDLKHMLLCSFSSSSSSSWDDYDYNDDDDANRLFIKKNFNKFGVEMNTTTTTTTTEEEEEKNNNDSEDEAMFLDMVKHIEPKVYIKSVRRRKWRDH